MTHGRGVPSKSIINCNRTGTRPYLDGKLDEALWSKAQRVSLKSRLRDDEQWPAVAMFAADAEYLYLAVNCRKASGANYRTTSKRRQRDTDLADRDRVDILLDVDRDYASYYRLTVDHRGWGRDDCFGDLSWNPKWSIAVLDEATQWSAEMAIPWKGLAPEAPASKAVWAVGVQRTIPGVGF